MNHPPEPILNRRNFLLQLAAASPLIGPLTLTPLKLEAALQIHTDTPLIHAPNHPAAWPDFRHALERYRNDTRQKLNYNDAPYRDTTLTWTQHCFCCGFVMACDQQFYDPTRGRYRVNQLVLEAQTNFGGFDAVVLWHAYPRIGVDPRNQFDFYRDLPRGILGLRDVIRQFHHHHVRVFLNYNPWDTGTRREPKEDVDVLSTIIQAVEADGLFLDTLSDAGADFRARLDPQHRGVALESELALPVERLMDHHLSWAQWLQDSHAPGVLRNKWIERRHLQHQIRRWDQDHSGELHTAWMNGSGMLVWENVFGSWVGWTPRDRSILRLMLPIQRRYAALFTGENWTPLVPTHHPEVYASLWVAPGLRLWTIVNRSTQPIHGPILTLTPQPNTSAFDLVAGEPAQLVPTKHPSSAWHAHLNPRTIGCLIETSTASLNPDFHAFLKSQSQLARNRTDATTPELRVTRLQPARATRRTRRPPPGMIPIPGAHLTLRSSLRVRECGFYQSIPEPPGLASSYDIQYRHFDKLVMLEPYAIDATPVTNAQFDTFLKRSGYQPHHSLNLLKHWGHGHPPAGEEDHPVVWVDLDDARAYANWARKRLPTEAEWQFAAQGAAALPFPWGPHLQPNRCNDGSHGAHTTPVNAYPDGRSPFGVWDLCGNVWEWTESEHTDDRTRFCLLKGGSYYRADGSNWYFEGGPQPNDRSAKFLLMWSGLDRCSTVGFRCVADLS